MSTRSKFVYRGDKRSVESVVRKSKQSGGAYDSYLLPDIQMFKVKEGESTVRIMPPSWDEKSDAKWGDGWDIQVFLHYGVGPDNATYLCLDKMSGETCPICEARRKSTDEDERDALRSAARFLCWAIDRDNEKAGPQVWSMPTTVFREINLRSVDKKHNTPIPVDDPENGYDIIFSREGSNKKTKYSAFEIDRDPTPLADDEKLQDRWLNYISEHPLPECLQIYDAKHIEGVLFGRAAGTDPVDADDGGTSAPRGGLTRGDQRAGGRARADEEKDYLDDEPEKEEVGRRPSRARGGVSRSDDAIEEETPSSAQARADIGARRGSAVESDEPDEDVAEEEEETVQRGRRVDRSGGTRRGTGVESEPEESAEEPEETAERARGSVARLSERRKSRR